MEQNSTAKKRKLRKYFHKYRKLRQSEVVIVHDDTFMRSLCADCAYINSGVYLYYTKKKSYIRLFRRCWFTIQSQLQEVWFLFALLLLLKYKNIHHLAKVSVLSRNYNSWDSTYECLHNSIVLFALPSGFALYYVENETYETLEILLNTVDTTISEHPLYQLN